MAKLIPITYHSKKYQPFIESHISEVAGHIDKKKISVLGEYSLHTEYSYMGRKFDSPLIADLPCIRNANINGIPQLWKGEDWAKEFATFIIRLIDNNNPPKIIEIHPPFKDYCTSVDSFLEIYWRFEEKIKTEFPNTIILLENRFGTLYKGSGFLVETGNDVVDICSKLSNSDIKLEIVLDYPQLFSAEKIKLGEITDSSLEKIFHFNANIAQYKAKIGGFHLWGKRKGPTDKRWVPHVGDLNSFFSGNQDHKLKFLASMLETYADSKERFFVPEVNSGEEDVHSIVQDLLASGFEFVGSTHKTQELEAQVYIQFIDVKWVDGSPRFLIYDSARGGEELLHPKQITSISRMRTRRCAGKNDILTKEYIPCPRRSIVQETKSQCSACSYSDEFFHCLGCKGECSTANKAALAYCDSPHYVYLAYFPQKIIKVGTAQEARKLNRLKEQGALYALIMAKASSGRAARKIEEEVREMGYPASVNRRTKLACLFDNRSIKEIHDMLHVAYTDIAGRISASNRQLFLACPEFFCNEESVNILESLCDNNYGAQFSLLPQPKKLNYSICTENSFFGTILTMVGKIALSRLANGSLSVFDFNALRGWEVHIE